jgi:N-acyl-D-aspartate/D-glutamate deacylase
VSFEIDPDDLLAGEENRLKDYIEHGTVALPLYAEPLDIPELRQCLTKTIRQQSHDVKPPAQIARMTAVRDEFECFSQLPPEILDNVLLHLQSKPLQSTLGISDLRGNAALAVFLGLAIHTSI